MEYENLLKGAYEKVELNVESSDERFEVPKVTGHIEKNRTILTNFMQIASHLERNPNHIIKFLTKELASQIEISGDRIFLLRKLSSKEINEKILKYVNNFVLCPNCKKPDTKIMEENSKIFIQCLACGEKNQIHKL